MFWTHNTLKKMNPLGLWICQVCLCLCVQYVIPLSIGSSQWSEKQSGSQWWLRIEIPISLILYNVLIKRCLPVNKMILSQCSSVHASRGTFCGLVRKHATICTMCWMCTATKFLVPLFVIDIVSDSGSTETVFPLNTHRLSHSWHDAILVRVRGRHTLSRSLRDLQYFIGHRCSTASSF